MRVVVFFIALLFIGRVFLFATNVCAQNTNINFHKLGFNEGLHDGIIRCIAQDKLGYMWIGSVGAINRFNGKRVTRFAFQPGDSTSPYNSQPRSMCSDPEGRFWIGCETGLMEYDFMNNRFKRMASLKRFFVQSLVGVHDSLLFLATRSGLVRYNKKQGSVFNFATSTLPEHKVLQNQAATFLLYHQNRVFVGTRNGLVVYDPVSNAAALIQSVKLAGTSIFSLSADSKQNIWICGWGKVRLACLSSDLKSIQIYDNTFKADDLVNEFVGVVHDRQDKTWLITDGSGLFQIDPNKNSYKKFVFNPVYPAGPSTNSWQCIFRDAAGIIWLGCNIDGVNYFEPNRNMFTTLLPFPELKGLRSGAMGRGVTVDKNGNIWMGNHDGLSKFDPVKRSYTIWRNEVGKKQVLYSNTIRTLLYADNAIWIGTGAGVNRYNLQTGKMEFVDSGNLPLRFYNAILEDKSGHIWFCTNDSASLYWYDLQTKKYHSIAEDSVLKKYVRFAPTSYILEDSKQRFWISFGRKGIVVLDKVRGTTKFYQATDTGTHSLIGNQVIDMKEDYDGKIWAATFTGLSCIDTDYDYFTSYTSNNGLPGNMVSSVAIDKQNRVWAGVNGGLTMLSADRKRFVVFLESDGLPSVGFPEHAAIQTTSGEVIMPTYKGYFLFNPKEYSVHKTHFPFYVTGYDVFNKHYHRVNVEDSLAVIRLKPAEHSFTLYLDALNYSNPSQSWFAYRLEGFEQEWHVSRDPKAVYTNIPGGNYTFVYKASSTNNHWDDVPSKSISIKIDTHFYTSTWFYIVAALALLIFVFLVYRYRQNQREKLMILENKAQTLEKEKAMVMYENLKQQLNPHFLFNSLTSLNSLISSASPDLASGFLNSLSKSYRYILKSRESETVPLIDEINFAENYIKLQKTRFEHGFSVKMYIPEEYHHRRIVPVTLQNLIENAIKHNIMDHDSPLLIVISVEQGVLIVQNNLQKKKFVETSNRQGLSNLQSLYRYLSNQPVEIKETENSFIVKIPLL